MLIAASCERTEGVPESLSAAWREQGRGADLDKSSLSFYDDRIQAWNAETGEFEAKIGFSSDNIVQKLSFIFVGDK
jgi:hypothetical protein